MARRKGRSFSKDQKAVLSQSVAWLLSFGIEAALEEALKEIREVFFLYCPSRRPIPGNKGTHFPLLSFLEPIFGGFEGNKGKRSTLFPENGLLSEK
jgi:hypothetical protein